MKHKRLPPNVFDAEIHFLYGTREEINAYLSRHAPDDEGDTIEERQFGALVRHTPASLRERVRWYMCVVKGSPVTKRGVLVHEAVHCATSILDAKNVHFDYENDETLAFLTEWLFREGEKVLA